MPAEKLPPAGKEMRGKEFRLRSKRRLVRSHTHLLPQTTSTGLTSLA